LVGWAIGVGGIAIALQLALKAHGTRQTLSRLEQAIRQNKSPAAPIAEIADLDFVVDEGPTREQLAEAIGGLPDRQKLVVTLYYYEELTFSEIGEVLGITESRVTKLHIKATRRLKGLLSRPSRRG